MRFAGLLTLVAAPMVPAYALMPEFTDRDRVEQTLVGLDRALGYFTAVLRVCDRTEPAVAAAARRKLADFEAQYPAAAKYLAQSPGATRTRRALKVWDREDPEWPSRSPQRVGPIPCAAVLNAIETGLDFATREIRDFDVSTLKPWPYVPPRDLDPPPGRERAAVDADIESCRNAGKDGAPLSPGALAGMNGESTFGFLGRQNSVRRGPGGGPAVQALSLPEGHPLRAQMPNADAFAACLLGRGYTLRVEESVGMF